jgi:hypothetical protein
MNAPALSPALVPDLIPLALGGLKLFICQPPISTGTGESHPVDLPTDRTSCYPIT